VGIAFTSTGTLFFNEWQTGRIRVAAPGFQLRSDPFYTVSNLVTGGERGLLGIALDPYYQLNGFVYVYYTAANPLRNRIIRLTDTGGYGTDETPIVDDLPASGANHNGGAMAFGPDGRLYVVVGDTDVSALSQQAGSLAGKVLRYDKDGGIPADNPVPGSPVYALGVRNSFGLAFHPHTGDLWETENGPASDDEVNRIVPGGNYGWPLAMGIANDPRFVDPILSITPTVAPTGIAVASEASIYPAEYHDNLFFAEANSGTIRRIALGGAALDQLGTASVAYSGGAGGIFALA
jgi:glucose/arabinose dehydrogenase